MAVEKVTIYDLAKALGISPSTVSRALQNHPRISQTTKDKVQQIAKDLHFQTDLTARLLRTGKSKVVGIVVPLINRYFFSSVIGAIEHELSAAGYQAIICQSHEKLQIEKEIIETLLHKKIDALALSLSAQSDHYKHFDMLLGHKTPIVFFDRTPQEYPASKVIVDNYQGAFMATEHLIQQGYSCISHLAGPSQIGVYRDRIEGYKAALQKHNLRFNEQWIIPNTITLETGVEAAKRLLSLSDRPDAIFSAGDFSALGAMNYCESQGIAIPNEIGIVGYANEMFGAFVEPKLTSINQFPEKMGRKVAHLILDSIAHPEREISTCQLTPELIVRESSLRKDNL